MTGYGNSFAPGSILTRTVSPRSTTGGNGLLR